MTVNLKVEEFNLAVEGDDELNHVQFIDEYEADVATDPVKLTELDGEVQLPDATVSTDATEPSNDVDQDNLHHFIIRWNDKDMNIRVDTETAYLLQTDLDYAEKFVSSLMEKGVVKSKKPKKLKIIQESLGESSTEPAKEDTTQSAYRRKYPSKPLHDKGVVISAVTAGAWTQKNVCLLLDLRFKMEDLYRNPSQNKPTLWKGVAEQITRSSSVKVSGDDCRLKFNYLVKKYRTVFRLQQDSGKPSRWPYYDAFHKAYAGPVDNNSTTVPMVGEVKKKKAWSDTDTWALVNMRLSMQDKFTTFEGDNDLELWEEVCIEVNKSNNKYGPKTPLSCKSKWFYLLVQYRKMINQSTLEEERNSWPYFPLLHNVLQGSIPNKDEVDKREKSAVWGASVTQCLLETRIEMDSEFANTWNKRTTLWKKVASKVNATVNVNVTGEECHDRYRNTFRTYKNNVMRSEILGQPSSWRYFDIMHAAYKGRNLTLKPEVAPSFTHMKNLWYERSNKLLIKFRLELNSAFAKRTLTITALWFQISKKMNAATKSQFYTWMACHSQWRNLRLEYDDIIEIRKITGKCNTSWPYFALFHRAFGERSYVATVESNTNNVDDNDCVKLVTNVDVSEHNYANEEEVSTQSVHESPVLASPSASTSKRLKPSATSPAADRLPSRCTNKSSERRDEHEKFEEPQRTGKRSKGEKEDSGHKIKGWFKAMLSDWKNERQQRWEEKKQLEKEKIKAINNLTKAILTLDPDVDLNLDSEINVKRQKRNK